MPSYTPVAALLRGLDVLRVVNQAGAADVRTLHAETGHDKATIVRMLETLIHAGYVVQEAGCYRPTGKVLQLSAGYDRMRQFEQVLTPVMAGFRAEVGWPSDFAMPDGTEMIVIETSRDHGPLSFNRRKGFRAPVLATSLGRAYLAYCPEAERDTLLRQLRDRAAAVSAPFPSGAELTALLETVRQDGFATMDPGYSDQEYGGTFWALAVPVQGARLYGALNLMLLRQAVSPDTARGHLLPKLQATAAALAGGFDRAGL